MDKNRIEEIKSLIGGGLVRDVPTIRQAWIGYGTMLLECPHKQGAKIGEWVREMGLDFVINPSDRSHARQLAELTLVNLPKLNLEQCPYSSPTAILNWLRKQEKQQNPTENAEVEQQDEPASNEPSPLKDVNSAYRALRIAMAEYMRTCEKNQADPATGLTDPNDTSASSQGLCHISLVGGETYEDAIYRQPDGDETHEAGGSSKLLGYAKVRRCRIVVEDIDCAVWADVPGVSGWSTVLDLSTLKEKHHAQTDNPQ